MMPFDFDASLRQVSERVPMRRKHLAHVVEFCHLVQGFIECQEGIVLRTDPGNVRRNRGQHVVSGEKQTQLGAVQANMIFGVTRCVNDEPITAGKFQDIALGNGIGDRGND